MKTFKKLLLPLCLTAALSAGITACTIPGASNESESLSSSETSSSVAPITYTLSLTADKTTALRGDVVTLSAYLISADAENKLVEDATFQIVEGNDAATLTGNTLTIAQTAANNTVVKVKATVGETNSNIVEIKVSVPLTTITASANGVTNVPSNSFVSLSKTIAPEGANVDGMAWVITEGSEYAVINGDLLLISATAPEGASIKLKATCGDIESNELSFTIGIPATSVTATLVGSTNVNPGDSAIINVTATPSNASTTGMAWVFTEGEEYCTIANNILTVDKAAPIGATISFKALLDGNESETITLTVGTPIESITIQASKTEIVKGQSAILSASVLPSGANEAYAWVITEGEAYATLFENSLIVNEDASTDAIIKVKAVSASGNVQSETELSFTVLPTQEELNATKYYFDLSTDQIVLDKYATSAPVLSVELWNYNYEQITDKEIVFTITEGAEYLSITTQGNVCTFTALGHGVATVTVSADGVSVTEEIQVEVLVPPSALALPGVFTSEGRNNYQYNYSMYAYSNDTVSGKDALPFVVTAVASESNANPCNDVVYTFAHEDGTVGDEVATYADGEITFNKTGLVTVTATSNSGSRMEASISYTFNINEGYNVYTFQEAASLLQSSYYQGQVVNFVVLEKPKAEFTDEQGNNPYGYDLVPNVALKKQSDQAFVDIIASHEVRIIAVNKSVHINGNKHTINASNVRLLTEDEIDAGNKEYGKAYANHGGLLSAEPWTDADDPSIKDVTGEFYVRMYDLTVKGNVPLNYENATTPGKFIGGYMAAINVGTQSYSAKYSIDIQNVTASNARDGFKMNNVIKGTLKNAYAHDCYQNGFALKSSIMAIENLKLGQCGAVGIELQPEGSNQAGRLENELQTITFQGTIDAFGNLHSLDTSYLNTYLIPLAPGVNVTVPQLVDNSILINGLTENQLKHLRQENANTKKMEYCMVTFMLMGTVANESVAQYPAYQEGGIIDATALPSSGMDTTHQFIRLTIYAAQGMPIGRVLLYNVNYGKTV